MGGDGFLDDDYVDDDDSYGPVWMNQSIRKMETEDGVLSGRR